MSPFEKALFDMVVEPTWRDLDRLIASSKYEEVRGIVFYSSPTERSVAIVSSDFVLHEDMSRHLYDMKVAISRDYDGCRIWKSTDSRAKYGIDYPALYHRFKCLSHFPTIVSDRLVLPTREPA